MQNRPLYTTPFCGKIVCSDAASCASCCSALAIAFAELTTTSLTAVALTLTVQTQPGSRPIWRNLIRACAESHDFRKSNAQAKPRNSLDILADSEIREGRAATVLCEFVRIRIRICLTGLTSAMGQLLQISPQSLSLEVQPTEACMLLLPPF